MEITGGVMILVLTIIIVIFVIAQYGKKSKFQKICEKIARFLLLGVITLSDEDRKSLFK